MLALSFRLLIGNELDLNLKFKYCLKKLKLRFEKTEPFYLIYTETEGEGRNPSGVDATEPR